MTPGKPIQVGQLSASTSMNVTQSWSLKSVKSTVADGRTSSNRLTSRGFTSPLFWSPSHLNLKPNDNQTNQPQINWQPNQLRLGSIDKRWTWISNQMNSQPNHLTLQSDAKHKSLESQNQSTSQSLGSQINWHLNLLNLKSIANHSNWNSNQSTTKIIRITHPLTVN